MRSSVLVVLVVVLAVGLVGTLVAQQPGGGRGGMGRGRMEDMTPEQRAEMFQRMQERQLTRLQEQMGASDEEWAVLSEPIKALLVLQREGREAGMELRGLLRAEGTTAEQLKEALAKYRKALKDIAAKREKLQAQLKEVVSVRQEAVLVLEGILD